tara:strand:- start:241 stop:642 length:402 start_codon:yes stop_codon:yes gene_type:complete
MSQVMTFNLTEKKISETFQNLLQKSDVDNKLYDLEGNYVTDFTVEGKISASYIQFSDGTTMDTAYVSSDTGDWKQGAGFQSSSLDIRITGIVSASGDFITEGKLQLGKLESAPTVVEGSMYYNSIDKEFYLGK